MRMIKKCESEPEGRGTVGERRFRWLEDVRHDLRELEVKS
jgi:hypothetical protein